jgi:hypothetical protein
METLVSTPVLSKGQKAAATRAANKAKNEAKFSPAVLTEINANVEVKKSEPRPEKVTYLKEGVTGKQVMRSIFNGNGEHKKDAATFSFCLKRAKEFCSEFFSNLKGFDEKDLTPKNLIPFRWVSNEKRETFSVYEVEMMIKDFYAAKAEGISATEFKARKKKK